MAYRDMREEQKMENRKIVLINNILTEEDTLQSPPNSGFATLIF